MLAALPAELLEFQPARRGLLVLGRGVVTVLTLSTLQRHNLAGHGTFLFVYFAAWTAKPCPRLARISANLPARREKTKTRKLWVPHSILLLAYVGSPNSGCPTLIAVLWR